MNDEVTAVLPAKKGNEEYTSPEKALSVKEDVYKRQPVFPCVACSGFQDKMQMFDKFLAELR